MEAQELPGIRLVLDVRKVQAQPREQSLGLGSAAGAEEQHRGQEPFSPACLGRSGRRLGRAPREEPAESALRGRVLEGGRRLLDTPEAMDRQGAPEPRGRLPFRRKGRRGGEERPIRLRVSPDLDLVEALEERDPRHATTRPRRRELLHVGQADLGSEAVRGAVELGFPNVRAADEERCGQAVFLGERAPLRAQVAPRLLPVVLPEELLRSLEARLHGRGSRPGQDRRQEETPERRAQSRPQGVLPSGARKTSSQLATWARKARSPFREQVRS